MFGEGYKFLVGYYQVNTVHKYKDRFIITDYLHIITNVQ